MSDTEQAKQKIHEIYHGKRGYFFSENFYAYCRDDAVRQFNEWLEAKEIDSEKVRIVHTHHLGKDTERPYHTYIFIWRLDSKGNLNRPPCPECGSKEIISKGISWLCKSCGRWFLKKRRGNYYVRIKRQLGKRLYDFWMKLKTKYKGQQVSLGDVLNYPNLAETIAEEYGISSIETIKTLMSEALFEYENRGNVE